MLRQRVSLLMLIAAVGGCAAESADQTEDLDGPAQPVNELTAESAGYKYDLESPLPFRVID
ncbi:MAG: hypothetical protein RLZZ450_4287 [Pseudomonadota bacterium]|jgi:hypothetical protein